MYVYVMCIQYTCNHVYIYVTWILFFLIHVLLYCNHFLYSCVWHSKTLEACMKLSKFEEERSI